MKFGGSSLANAARIKTAARIVQRFSPQNKTVVVASAIDDTTDQLVEIGELAQKGEDARARKILSRIQTSHTRTARATSPKKATKEPPTLIDRLNRELVKTVEGISHLRELTPRSRDYLLSFGERLSAPILTAAIRNIGLKTRALTGAEAGITSDERFGDANPLAEVSYHEIRRHLDPMLARNEIPVIAGFIAATLDGRITTLGRGGSHYTANLLGAAINADKNWICAEVYGLINADPPNSQEARRPPSVSFGGKI